MVAGGEEGDEWGSPLLLSLQLLLLLVRVKFVGEERWRRRVRGVG